MERYPCIGRWRFLYLSSPETPRFKEVLGRLKDGGPDEAILDLGCCMGQALRQLAHHGVDGSRLYGSDLRRDFIELGYELFRDRETLEATFATGDMLDPKDAGLRRLDGKVTIVHAQSFWHLFDWAGQVAAAVRLVRFFRPGADANAMVYGRHIGTVKPGEVRTARRTLWLHDQESFQRLWDEVGEETGTKWRAEVQHTGELPVQIPGMGNDARASSYVVYRVA